MSHRQQGFTLLELLVAVAIFAIMAALAYGGLNAVLSSREQVAQQSAELAALQKAFFRISRDIGQAVPRGIRDGFGDNKTAMLNNRGLLEDKEDAFEFTRTGRFNPTGEARSALQRIAYGVEDGQLVRYSWNVLDRAQDSEPAKFVMLENIKRVELQFLDASGQWQKSWPLSNEADIQAGAEIFGVKAAPPPQNMPLAIEFTIEMEALGKVVRIIRVS